MYETRHSPALHELPRVVRLSCLEVDDAVCNQITSRGHASSDALFTASRGGEERAEFHRALARGSAVGPNASFDSTSSRRSLGRMVIGPHDPAKGSGARRSTGSRRLAAFALATPPGFHHSACRACSGRARRCALRWSRAGQRELGLSVIARLEGARATKSEGRQLEAGHERLTRRVPHVA